jgi:hypothetical protein
LLLKGLKLREKKIRQRFPTLSDSGELMTVFLIQIYGYLKIAGTFGGLGLDKNDPKRGLLLRRKLEGGWRGLDF